MSAEEEPIIFGRTANLDIVVLGVLILLSDHYQGNDVWILTKTTYSSAMGILI